MDLTIDSRERLAAECARRFERIAATSIAARGQFSCALPGGSVAEACFPALAGATVDWSRTHMFWGDERAVPPDDPQSNYGIAWRLWLRHVDVAPDRIHRMRADLAELSGAADEYADELQRTLEPLHLDAPPRLDLILIGVGADGHIFSLFPEHPALRVRGGITVIAVTDAPKPPARRLTLTLRVITAARELIVCTFGEAKALAVRDGLRRGRVPSPLALATWEHPNVTWLLDAAAAAFIKRP